MKLKKMLLWILLLGILGTQTSCSKQEELGQISVATGFFLDISHGNYILLADCTDFREQESGKQLQTKPLLVISPSFEEAFQELISQSEQPLYCARAKVFLLGKNLSEQSTKDITNTLFSSRLVRPDITVLRSDFTWEALKEKEYQPFGFPVDEQLKKQKNPVNSKLYQIIKNHQTLRNIPTVHLTENGFYLTNIQKEGPV